MRVAELLVSESENASAGQMVLASQGITRTDDNVLIVPQTVNTNQASTESRLNQHTAVDSTNVEQVTSSSETGFSVAQLLNPTDGDGASIVSHFASTVPENHSKRMQSSSNSPQNTTEHEKLQQHKRQLKPTSRKRGYRPSQREDLACEFCSRRTSPEWRRGPSGANTLCNACGIRYAKRGIIVRDLSTSVEPPLQLPPLKPQHSPSISSVVSSLPHGSHSIPSTKSRLSPSVHQISNPLAREPSSFQLDRNILSNSSDFSIVDDSHRLSTGASQMNELWQVLERAHSISQYAQPSQSIGALNSAHSKSPVLNLRTPSTTPILSNLNDAGESPMSFPLSLGRQNNELSKFSIAALTHTSQSPEPSMFSSFPALDNIISSSSSVPTASFDSNFAQFNNIT